MVLGFRAMSSQACASYQIGLPSFSRKLLRESLVLAGWVGLWHPMELFLYAWWPDRERIGDTPAKLASISTVPLRRLKIGG